eukprot:TRINITY_DN2436_c0_g2_i5.p1 TRINITY_DN2436_c0_g2~~TRINITY_DN2436_c0_g2_i5.p1  ORF type:complete len:566 (-),score=204.95 TRINITY_DN2436_c0_g2_i5:1691-3388(-)
MIESESGESEYVSYCRTCKEPLGKDDEEHGKGHVVEPLVSALKLTDLVLEMEKTRNLKKVLKSLGDEIPMLSALLNKLVGSFKDKLHRIYRAFGFEEEKKDFIEWLEGNAREKVKKLDGLKAQCEGAESSMHEQIIGLKIICGDVKAQFKGDSMKAYNALKQLEEYQKKRKEVEELRRAVEEQRSRCGKCCYKESLQDFSEDVALLKLRKNIIENNLESAKAQFVIDLINSEHKILRRQIHARSRQRHLDPADEEGKTMERLTEFKATYSREKESFLTMVSNKIRELKQEVSSMEERRKAELAEAKKYLEAAQNQKETIFNQMLVRVDKVYINESEFAIPQPSSLEDISKLEGAVLKYKDLIESIEEQRAGIEKLIAIHSPTIQEIVRCGVRVQQNSLHKQIDSKKLSLEKLIEDKRKRLEEALGKTEKELHNIVESILANPTEREFRKVKAALEEIPPTFDSECKEIATSIQNQKMILESSMGNIEETLSGQIMANGKCLVCEYGKTGKVQLSCGHRRCLQCIADNRIKHPEDVTMPCSLCDGVYKRIGRLANHRRVHRNEVRL